MKKIMKKSLSLVMALAVMITGVLVIPTAGNKAAAASPSFYGNQTVYYETNSPYTTWKVNVPIFNCTKATQIKNLKSSNTSIAKVKAKPGSVDVYYYKKAGTVTISCKVGSKKISTKVTVKKYSSPIKQMKIGSTDVTSKFKGCFEDYWYHTKSFKNQKVTLKAKSGWQIYSVFVSTDSKNFSKYRINKSSYTIPKLTYNGRFDSVWVTYQKKSNPSEIVEVRLNMVKE